MMLSVLKIRKDRIQENARRLIAEWRPMMERLIEKCRNGEPSGSQLIDESMPVYLLGKKFIPSDTADIEKFVLSRLWFSYRKNFHPIGGTGPTSDEGWGCMLRCGQMLLAQALATIHLGEDWSWNPREVNPESDVKYKQLIRMFQDDKDCIYSIHQIAQMGVSERKELGEWFGPNTVAQVLKKLVVFDKWSKIVVHVALDNVLISSDVQIMACTKPPKQNTLSKIRKRKHTGPNPAEEEESSSDEESTPSNVDLSINHVWPPIVLIIPLRLGLTNINRCYLPAIMAFFQIPQCIGIIGGQPNHALYFLGISNDMLLYLDPHCCQEKVDLDAVRTSTEQLSDFEKLSATFDDSTYHCPFIFGTKFENMDPSLALGFLCRSESDYRELVHDLRKNLLNESFPPLFELLDERPKNFPEFVPYVQESAVLQDYTDLGEVNDSYDEFELLE